MRKLTLLTLGLALTSSVALAQTELKVRGPDDLLSSLTSVKDRRSAIRALAELEIQLSRHKSYMTQDCFRKLSDLLEKGRTNANGGKIQEVATAARKVDENKTDWLSRCAVNPLTGGGQ
ncbi:MAG: hypothetical protein JNL01_02205 [Bdellovibrionales bacterium]|nr:hypothetical protein [Bdellovibrionales bacterium]